jgi:hypothetical protein
LISTDHKYQFHGLGERPEGFQVALKREIHGLYRVSRIQRLANLGQEFHERDGPVPQASPRLENGRVCAAPLFGKPLKGGSGGASARGQGIFP